MKKVCSFLFLIRNIWAKFDQNLRGWVTKLKMSLFDIKSPNCQKSVLRQTKVKCIRNNLLPLINDCISQRFESFGNKIFKAIAVVDHHRWDFEDSNYGVKHCSKFALVVGKCWGFCWGISPFYSICLCNKNVKAIKFLESKKKKVFLELKNKYFVKENKISFIKKIFFKRHNLLMCFYINYSYLHFVYSYLYYTSALKRSSFPETLLCYALNEVIDVIHFFLSK